MAQNPTVPAAEAARAGSPDGRSGRPDAEPAKSSAASTASPSPDRAVAPPTPAAARDAAPGAAGGNGFAPHGAAPQSGRPHDALVGASLAAGTSSLAAGTNSLAAGLPASTLLRWLRDMLLIREFEVRTMQAYQDKKIGGFCHVYIGQEAVAVGCTAAVEHRDPIVTAYRDHGHALARGMAARHCMAEMFGRIGGCAKGKGGSMHMFDKANNLFGGHGIVGAQTPLGAGLAFATKYEDEVINAGATGGAAPGKGRSDRVTLCFLGDGALNQGAFHEAKNLAGLLDLPVVYVVENNGYSMGTAISRGTTMGHNISVKAAAYGIESIVVDGMDVLNVYDAMKPLCDRVRRTSRPAFVDMRTYRYKGHSMSDPRKYRTPEEEQQYETLDPIGRLMALLEQRGALTKEGYDAMVQDVRREVREAVKWADASPPTPLSELYTDVYVERWGPYTGTSEPEMLREQGGDAKETRP